MPTKEKSHHEVNVFPTPLPKISAKINIQHYKDRSASLHGYLVDTSTTLRHDSDIESSTEAKTPDQIPLKETILVSRLVQKYTEKTSAQPIVSLSDHPYTSAYATLSEEDQKKLFPKELRAPTTRAKALSHFAKTMLPLLDEYGLDLDATDRHDILVRMQADAESHGNHLGNPELTRKTVVKNARNFNRLYAAMRLLLPDYGLPEVELPIPSDTKAIETEQCKALPDAVRVKTAVALEHIIPNGLAAGGAIMLSGLARTAEACAPRFSELLIFDTHAVFGILYQADGTFRVADLKTDSSYRPVVLPRYARDLLMMRIDWLRKQGFSDEEIKSFPVTASRDDPRVQADPKDLSALMRDILSMIGCSQGYWQAVETSMLIEPDFIEHTRTPYRDPSAYATRRAGCTAYSNLASIEPDLLDAVMGHKLPKHCQTDWVRWLRRPANWPILAAQMERVIFDPRHSAHPLFSPVVLQANNSPYHSAYSQIGYRFQADPLGPEIEIEICITSSEAGDYILLTAPSPALSADAKPIYPSDHTKYPPILGPVHGLDTYMQWIREAEALDLDKFLPKNKKGGYYES